LAAAGRPDRLDRAAAPGSWDPGAAVLFPVPQAASTLMVISTAS
jgi:hypothetical protein